MNNTYENGLLDKIDSPRDLKKLSVPELDVLAKEIRDRIVETVSKTGGHLAASLGVVELTLALHYVFDAPRDKIIWDVGHQAYAHKLLTGRRDKFHTLRSYGGISGFPKRSESPYDTFDTGHSSTSISAGLGISTALSLDRKKEKVIAVIGDGSMTGGMAFEGLNQAGYTGKDLIVVLNDNAMSIAPNVGAFSSFISRKMAGKRFVGFKRDLENFIVSLPGVGENILRLIQKSEDSIISFFTPGMLFEAFKFRYIGPINGHRVDRLIDTFKEIRELEGPVLVHVLTVKGKGYEFAEKDPSHFHGVGAFDVCNGTLCKPKEKQPPSYTSVFGRSMVELGRKDRKLFAITAAMPEGTGLADFGKTFPDRFVDVGIAEQHAVTFAAGLATEGYHPVVAIYSTFLQRAYDQIIHDVSLQNLHVVFAIDRGGLVGADGPTHHGAFDISYLRCIPNMTVMAPKDENELRHMLYSALYHYDNGPVAIRYPRGKGIGVPLDEEYRELPYGVAEKLREGRDLVIYAIGSMVYPALAAADRLSRKGISAGVINCRFVKPLDRDLVRIAEETGHVLVVEENVLMGGFGSAVLELLSDAGVYVRLRRIGIPDIFVEHGPVDILRANYGMDVDGIIREAEKLLDDEKDSAGSAYCAKRAC